MKAYWDSSALVEAHMDPNLHARLTRERGFARTHSLTETFSSLSGNQRFRFSANDAAAAVNGLLQYLDLVELTGPEIGQALAKAQALGVRGGRVHDYMHAIAAEKCGADKLLTLDRNDFAGLVQNVSIEQL